jgi:hypothetical protein
MFQVPSGTMPPLRPGALRPRRESDRVPRQGAEMRLIRPPDIGALRRRHSNPGAGRNLKIPVLSQPLSKTTLIKVADSIRSGDRIDATLVEPFLDHSFPETSQFGRFMLKLAAWISLFFASVLAIFPEVGEFLIATLPGFFLLPERLARALDYVWGLVGKPVGKQHLMYHLPNIIIYAFGVAGVRKLWRRINRNNWKDRVEDARKSLSEAIAEGTARIAFPAGFSLLFTGDGDQVAKSLVADNPLIGPTLASRPPPYTRLWGRFVNTDGDEGFFRVMNQFNSEEAGEYLLFPVVDAHVFLPGKQEYDIAPHRVEISVRRIREFEKQKGWPEKKIVIVGDKEQRSTFVTSSMDDRFTVPSDEISLHSIEGSYDNVIIADPTELTLRRIVEIADGRQILFRASDRGIEKYAAEFYHRLSLLGHAPTRDGKLIVGYDISDLETEHQVVSQKNTDYLPVILSQDVFDLLSDRYLREGTFIFVPLLVKRELQRLVD